MTVAFRATAQFLDRVRRDLVRPHAYAAERVGFISVKAAQGHEKLVLLAQDFHPVADDDYINDPSVGAMMGPEAIRKALNVTLLQPVGMFHVHLHDHRGRPGFSRIDLREQLKLIPNFFKLRREMPHGAIVLSLDAAHGRCWLAHDAIVDVTEFQAVGRRNVVQSATGRGRIGLDVIA